MIDCELKKPNSELSWKSMRQYGYAVNLLVLQEQAGLSFFEARVYLSGIRNERRSKIAKEFDNGYDEDSLEKLFDELSERIESRKDLPYYAFENCRQYDICWE